MNWATRLGLVFVFLGCSSSESSGTLAKSSPAQKPKLSEAAPPPAKVPDQDEDEDDGPEEADVDWKTEVFSADLDGDGKVEAISWKCTETSLVVKVGRDSEKERLSISDLTGCPAGVISAGPGGKRRLLWVTAEEHEEAGPPSHFLYAYRAGKLNRIWSKDARVSIFTDGSWTTESSKCVDKDRSHETTTQRMTWDGKAVQTEKKVERSPTEAGDCEEQDDP